MQKDSGTRSGMLWEVERLLLECKDRNSLPQILLMENVPQVVGSKNVEDFDKWCNSLVKMGYTNFVDILNAKDYGIPQNRRRCFMVSILGNYSYKFPPKQKLNLTLKDMLESNVDEKYYLSNRQIEAISTWNSYQKPLEHIDEDIVKTITTRDGAYTSSMVLVSNKYMNSPKENITFNRYTKNKNKFILSKEELINNQLRLRQLTSKEMFRLMGFDDEDYDNARSVISENWLYHIAGDSIVVNVLEAIFKQFYI